MSHSKRVPVVGILLIVIGALLVLNHWHHIRFDWTTVLMLLGAVLFAAGLMQHDRGAVFPGTFLFLFGFLFYAQDRYILPFSWWELWPAIILCLGIAFLVHAIFNPKKRGTLVPGIVLTTISLILLYFPFCWYDIFYWASKLWPVLLILAGIHIILRSRRDRRGIEHQTKDHES